MCFLLLDFFVELTHQSLFYPMKVFIAMETYKRLHDKDRTDAVGSLCAIIQKIRLIYVKEPLSEPLRRPKCAIGKRRQESTKPFFII